MMLTGEQPGINPNQLIEETREGRFVRAENQESFERFLQRSALGEALKIVENRFQNQDVVVYDPAAGIDRTIVSLVKPDHCIIGNPYNIEEDLDLRKQGVRFVEANFPKIPLEEESVNLISLNGVGLFDEGFLDKDRRQQTLGNMRKATKPGGILLITDGIQPSLSPLLQQETHVQTLGRSLLLPKIDNAPIGWQEGAKGKVKVQSIYIPATGNIPDFEEFKNLGWQSQPIDVVEVEQNTDVKLKGIILPAYMSSHGRKTLLEDVTAGYNYPIYCFKAI